MEDMYVKPGNQERGWNDPPQFSYGLQRARGPQKNLLNKRAAPGAPPMTPPPGSPLAPPPGAAAPPPLHPGMTQREKVLTSQPGLNTSLLSTAPPPAAAVATPPPPGPMRSQREADSSQSESEPDVGGVVSVLSRALAACRHTATAQVCNDVAKRLRLLEDSWRAGKLSLPVRRRMDALSRELRSGHWDSADEIHRSLMVDHVTEVSQWMVGVKRLIAETRKLSPELLEPLQKAEEPVQESTEPAQESTEPAQESTEPVQDSTDPVQDSTDPVQVFQS